MSQPVASEYLKQASILRREIRRLALPSIAEQFFGSLAQMVDMALVGPLGTAAVAAVGLSTQPLWFLMGPFIGINTGLAALISRAIGADQERAARAVARQGFWLGAFTALLVASLVWWSARDLAVLMGGKPEVVPLATLYTRSIAPGLAALFLNMVLGAMLQASGNTRTPFVVSAGVNLLNAPLSWALIYGHFGLPAMGLQGAGIATTIARGLGLLVMVTLLLKGVGPIRLEAAKMASLDWGLTRRILNVGLPASLDTLAGSAAYLLYIRMVSALGTVALAAHVVAVTVEQISWMIGTGLTTAAATLVGQSLGAGDPARARLTIRESLRIGALAIAPVALFFFYPVPGVRLFTRDPQVVALATVALRTVAIGEVPMIASAVLAGALMGAGDTRVMAGISLIGSWAVRLSLAALFVFGFGWGLQGAWIASMLDWLTRLGLQALRFRGGRWQEVRV